MFFDNIWFQISIWVLLIVFFIILESITNQLVSFWFSLGSLFALISVSFLNSDSVKNNLSFLYQFIIFFVSSIILFVPFIFYFKKRGNIHKYEKSDSLYLDEYEVQKTISNDQPGIITIKDVPYSCLPYNPKEQFPVGAKVRIKKFKGNIALVQKGE